MSNNELVSMGFLSFLPKRSGHQSSNQLSMKYLDLSHNKIENLIADIEISNITNNLEVLNLENNKITKIGSDTEKTFQKKFFAIYFKNLKNLNLLYNPIAYSINRTGKLELDFEILSKDGFFGEKIEIFNNRKVSALTQHKDKNNSVNEHLIHYLSLVNSYKLTENFNSKFCYDHLCSIPEAKRESESDQDPENIPISISFSHTNSLSTNNLPIIPNFKHCENLDLSYSTLSLNKIQNCNLLTKTLPNLSINLMFKLKVLCLENTCLKTLKDFENLIHVEMLFLGNNEIASLAEIYSLKSLTNLTVLDLSHNKICNEEDYRSFVIYHLCITTDKKNSYKNKNSSSGLASNLIGRVEGDAQASNEMNSITIPGTVPENASGSNKSSTYVGQWDQNSSVNNSSMTDLGSLSSKALQILDNSYLNEEEINNAKDMFGGRLTLDSLNEFLPHHHSNHKEIGVLNVVDQSIRTVAICQNFEDAEEALPMLHTINLEGNLLKTISGLIYFKNLKVLNLSGQKPGGLHSLYTKRSGGNGITSKIDSGHIGQVGLEDQQPVANPPHQLNINSNTKANVTFPLLPNLEVLHLANNQIKSINNLELIKVCPNLHVLFLQHNHLVKLSGAGLYGLSKLKQLILDNNRIKEISPGFFSSNEQIRELHISHNRLKTIPIQAVSSLQNIERLFLTDNKIASVEDLFNFEINSLHEISFAGNPVTHRQHRTSLIANQPNLQIIDGIPVSIEEREQAEAYLEAEFDFSLGQMAGGNDENSHSNSVNDSSSYYQNHGSHQHHSHAGSNFVYSNGSSNSIQPGNGNFASMNHHLAMRHDSNNASLGYQYASPSATHTGLGQTTANVGHPNHHIGDGHSYTSSHALQGHNTHNSSLRQNFQNRNSHHNQNDSLLRDFSTLAWDEDDRIRLQNLLNSTLKSRSGSEGKGKVRGKNSNGQLGGRNK